MSKKLSIRSPFGAKKGGGGRSEAPDTLQSTSYARFQDLICEGEIEGLVDGLKSVYFDDTPVQNSDNSYNFENINFLFTKGTTAQSSAPGFGAVESPTLVGAQVTFASVTGVTRTVSDLDVDAVRVLISFPALLRIDPETGDIFGTRVDFQILVKPDGGSFMVAHSGYVSGKASSTYQVSKLIPLPAGEGPWDIRIVRTTADSATINLSNEMFFDSFVTVKYLKLRYPSSVVASMAIDAKQFSSIPNRAYDLKLLKVKIPQNYNPLTREYATSGPGTTGGIWDGTFQVAWTDNPVWCFYDLLTNERYGLGGYIDETLVDKFTLYSIGQYCDEMVPSGYGGTGEQLEPRFTCNLFIQSREEAIRVLGHFASIFRGMIYWNSGQVFPVIDQPADTVAIFNKANVKDGSFSYSGTALRSRRTVALVRWNDPDDFFRAKIEYVEDRDAIDDLGIREIELTAFGCTSKGQAHRVGKWALFTEVFETEIVEFVTGLDALYLRPNDVIAVFDPDRATERLGGRVISSTSTQIVIDSPVDIESGKTYTLYLVVANGEVVTKTLTNSPAVGVVTLTWTGALAVLPVANGVWGLSIVDNIEPRLFRVLSSVEESKTEFRITAKYYIPGKYDFIENNIKFEEAPITGIDISLPIEGPETVTLSVFYTAKAFNTERFLDVTWDQVDDPRLKLYIVEYRFESNNWIDASRTPRNTVSFPIFNEGTYTVRVKSLSFANKESAPTYATISVVDSDHLEPEPVTDLVLATIDALDGDGKVVIQLQASWTLPDDIYVTQGGQIEVQYKPHYAATWIPLPLMNGDAVETRINGLTSGTSYDVRVRTRVLGVTSDFVSATAMLGGDTSIPGAPDDVSFSPRTGVPRNLFGVRQANARISWTDPTDIDLDYVELRINNFSDDPDGAATSTAVSFQEGITARVPKSVGYIDIYTLFVPFTNNFVHLRGVDRSGNPSDWNSPGINLFTVMAIPSTVSEDLDQISGVSEVHGTMAYRAASEWVALPPGTAGQVLTTQGVDADPEWANGGLPDGVTFVPITYCSEGVTVTKWFPVWDENPAP